VEEKENIKSQAVMRGENATEKVRAPLKITVTLQWFLFALTFAQLAETIYQSHFS